MKIMDEFEGAWISTQHVQQFHFLNPAESDIDIRDIAHSLSLQCRFGGHCSKFYSVAEHSILVSMILMNTGASKLDQMAGLLHDAEEAYLPDIPAPIKHCMPGATKLYEAISHIISHKFQLFDANWKVIDDIDKRLCTTEAKLLGIWNEDWYIPGEPLDAYIPVLPPGYAEDIFLARFKELGGKILACDMTMAVMGIKKEDLRDDLISEYCAVGTYINEARESTITLFI